MGSFHYVFTGSSPSYESIAALFFVGYLLARFVMLSPVGSVLIGINQNPTRTAALGHHVPGYKLAVFVLAGAYAGLAGALLGVFQSYMPPSAFALETSGLLVIQTVIGGAEILLGPAIGATVWLSLRDFLQQMPVLGDLWKFILGFAFVLLVTLLRRGVDGELYALWLRKLPGGLMLATAAAPLSLRMPNDVHSFGTPTGTAPMARPFT